MKKYKHSTKVTKLARILVLASCLLMLGCFNQDKLADALYGTLRKPINTSNEWGSAFMISQAELVQGTTKTLYMSGQAAIVKDTSADMGLRVAHEGDFRKQMEFALSNIDELLSLGGMDRDNIVRLRFFTTDMAAFLENYDIYSDWIESSGVMPTQTALGVNELALPGLMIEIEATATD